ncbi:SPOR domain-containing protein [Pseudoxanthomonas wuyuanensis]|uniref:Cell division protein DedD (Protein involved in septation) n=1 Tax=Pseudoxanthomonas wuyuanensis TaxID=1073196 RepID=A0A286D7E8_9GAMM|nr:SPOR domain-containing protein [Pseudoxanthomonas wuyuanensis]KAF1721020.1 SPOR domain-containing protein [Pseudoxanthomonas wuyuanensis]SOD54554.1 Cell division protein DedD (protein involved in septation) [Pseudoxanthomonas wuyuanensis]
MDTALKQRLIGAIVLVALAVIFLPMLIKGPAPDSGVSDVPLDVPPAPAGQYETRELPLVAPGQAPDNGALGMPAATAPAAQPTSAPAADEALPPASAAGNYAVSFGAYASIADAEAVIARLRQSQLTGYHEEATINGRPAYRVRVGPYLDRAAAESARLQAVKVRSDVNAQVIALDAASTAAPAASPSAAPTAAASEPEPAKPAVPAPKPAESTPAAPKPAAATPVAATPKPAEAPPAKTAPAAASVGFAVQLGAFTNAADANALRDRVRGGGFSAFVEQVSTDKGTLNRVRVGPVASRADAERLKAQVAVKFGIDGMVRPHP